MGCSAGPWPVNGNCAYNVGVMGYGLASKGPTLVLFLIMPYIVGVLFNENVYF
jgi:hypothetical protein